MNGQDPFATPKVGKPVGKLPMPTTPDPFKTAPDTTPGDPFVGIGKKFPSPPKPESFVNALFQGVVVNTLKDVSYAIRQMFTTGELGLQERVGSTSENPVERMKADLQQQVLGPATPEKEEQRQHAIRGLALIGSFAGAPVLGAIPAVGATLGKVGSFLAGEFLGGSIYGGIRPLDEDESRESAMLSDGAIFAAFGGVTHEIVPWALKRYILDLPAAKRRIALNMAREGFDRIETDLASGGVAMDQLPPEASAKLEESVLRTAVRVADPKADIGAAVQTQIDKDLAANARTSEEISTPGKPAEAKFKDEMERLRGVSDAELEAMPGGKTPPVGESALAREYTGPERRVAREHPVDIERRRGEPEQITGVAVKGQSGKIYNATAGEAAHPQIMARMLEGGVPESEFFNAEGQYVHSEVAGYTTNKRPFVSKSQATREGLEGATAKEYIVGPTVKGNSGKLYVGGATHNETIEQAVKSGVPESEFKGVGSDSRQRGFKTNVHGFVSRDYARQLVGHDSPLISEDLHKRGLTPSESPMVAEMKMETVRPNDPPEAALDAATDHAVASIKPLDMAEPSVKEDAKIISEETNGVPLQDKDKEIMRLQQLLAAALKQGEGAEKVAAVNLTDPTPGQIAIERGPEKGKTSYEQNRKRDKLGRFVKKDSPIKIEPTEQSGVPWTEKPSESPTLPKPLDGFQIAGRLEDSQLEEISKALISFAKSEKGAVTGRMLLLMTGSGIEWLSTSDRLTDGEKAGLRAIGGLMLVGAVGPRIGEWIQKSGFVKRFLLAYNPELMMNDFPKGKEAFRQYVETLTTWSQRSHAHAEAIRKVFPDEQSAHAAMYVMDEGTSAPEFHSLTAAQQREALAINQLMLRLGVLSRQHGILDEFRDSYVRNVMSPEAYQRWKLQGYRSGLTPDGTKARIYALRELEAFAKVHGLPPSKLDLAAMHSAHVGDATRMMASVRLRAMLEKLDLVKDAPTSAYATIPDGWRGIGQSKKMAPEVIAKALENISSSRPPGDVARTLDNLRSLWMRGVMFWWWEHGFNAMRSIINLSMNPAEYANIAHYMRDTDAIGEQMARYGGNLYDRPDYGPGAHEAFSNLLRTIKVSWRPITAVGSRLDRLLEMQDRILWDKMIPTLQKFTYASEMYKWTERTGGKFLEGSPEFTAQARRAADFANTVGGRVPRFLQDRKLAQGMRYLMFSPNWTMSRISLMANAAGEAGEILSGRLNPKDAMYLPFKMRQLAWGTAITYVGSMLMTGKAPVFNDKTSKFYMHTGLKSPTGREMGLDVIGWWQDDIRLFNAPFDYISNRLNPVVRIAGETLTGRDYLGRSMTTGQKIGNIITSFGPIPEAASDALRLGQAASGGRPIPGGEALQMASRASATFRVATIDRPLDVTTGKIAKRLLMNQGIPANSDNIFEVARLLRGNLLRGTSLVDQRLVTLLAYMRRGQIARHPIATSLWQETRRVIADFQ